jgi:hypothetical protein
MQSIQATTRRNDNNGAAKLRPRSELRQVPVEQRFAPATVIAVLEALRAEAQYGYIETKNDEEGLSRILRCAGLDFAAGHCVADALRRGVSRWSVIDVLVEVASEYVRAHEEPTERACATALLGLVPMIRTRAPRPGDYEEEPNEDFELAIARREEKRSKLCKFVRFVVEATIHEDGWQTEVEQEDGNEILVQATREMVRVAYELPHGGASVAQTVIARLGSR